MEYAYYYQVDITCILICLILLLIGGRKARHQGTEDAIIFKTIFATIVYCIADLGSWALDSRGGLVSRVFIYILNIIFISVPLFYSYVFGEYAIYKMEGKQFVKTRKGIVLAIPLFILALMVASTPWTNFAFVLSDTNTYSRKIGAYLVPALSWLYLFTLTGKILLRILRSGSLLERETLMPILFFAVPPAIATIIQLSSFGFSTVTTGFTFSVLLIFIARQKNQISRDELTGLNNRREFNRYISRRVTPGSRLTVFMIDMDKFKQINDFFGHLKGDKALQQISELLRRACASVPSGVFLARYGGDEFILAACDMSEKVAEDFILELYKELEIQNINNGSELQLFLSIGMASGTVNELSDITKLIETADKEMYKDKKSKYGKIF